jgi:hypothetical protein
LFIDNLRNEKLINPVSFQEIGEEKVFSNAANLVHYKTINEFIQSNTINIQVLEFLLKDYLVPVAKRIKIFKLLKAFYYFLSF